MSTYDIIILVKKTTYLKYISSFAQVQKLQLDDLELFDTVSIFL